MNLILPTENNVLPRLFRKHWRNRGYRHIFGLSGTGMTILSADLARKLIGEDEHGWTADKPLGEDFSFIFLWDAKLSKIKIAHIDARNLWDTNLNIDFEVVNPTLLRRNHYPVPCRYQF